ncbi:MAG: NADH-quinone oxidoreductase subunit D [Nitrososphaerota archaeon]|nr:NADH-quinone oxidoreductase subunit D [Candidatus Geocrenenecus dongiae]
MVLEEKKVIHVYDEGGPRLSFSYGPQHPGTGHFRMIVTVSGDTVVDLEPDPGFVHRGEEKMAEYKTWITNIPHFERPSILDATHMVLPYCLAVEKLMEVDPPERAKYLRTIVAELDRIASHLYWFSLYGIFLGHSTMFLWCVNDREFILDLSQLITGQRFTHAYVIPGGVRNDAPKTVPKDLVKEFKIYYMHMIGREPSQEELNEDFKKYVLNVADFMDLRLDQYYEMFFDSEIFIERTRGVGVLKREDAVKLGIPGTTLRASGVSFDTRVADPYDAYPYVKFKIAVRTEGDCYARAMVGFQEMRESLNIIRQTVEQMPEGPVKVKQHPVVIKVPKGEAIGRAEAARGEIIFYVVSDGADRPYRVRMITPSFRLLPALPHLSIGSRIADIPPIYWSLNYWPVETDR